MKNKTLIIIITVYIIFGAVWLLLGAWFVEWIDREFPKTDLRQLHHVKNLIFLFITAIAAIFGIKHYYKQLLNVERKYKYQLQQNEVELQSQLNLYDTVTRATNDVIWNYNIVNDELKWMSGYKEVFGYKDELITYNSFWNMKKIHIEDRDRVIQAFKHVLENKQTNWKAEYRYKCATMNTNTFRIEVMSYSIIRATR